METLHPLHALILRQQRLIEEQVALLNHCDSTAAPQSEMRAPLVAAPSSESKFLLLRQRLECWMASESPPSLLLIGEKESPSAVFIKYSQLLLKWAELELVLLRESQREKSSQHTQEELPPPTQEELQIIRVFLAENQSYSASIHR